MWSKLYKPKQVPLKTPLNALTTITRKLDSGHIGEVYTYTTELGGCYCINQSRKTSVQYMSSDDTITMTTTSSILGLGIDTVSQLIFMPLTKSKLILYH